MELSLRYLRVQVMKAGLWPTTRLARVACFFLAVDIFLTILNGVLRLFAGSSGGLGWWVKSLSYVLVLLFLFIAYRWVRVKILWRLRNRLIVTYVFIGVIPAVLLVTMAFVTLYLFAGQFASFLVTSQLDSRLRNLEIVNSAIANELAARAEHGEALTAESLEGLKRRDPISAPRQFCAWDDGKPLPLCKDGGVAVPFSLPTFAGDELHAITGDQNALYLRAGMVIKLKNRTLTFISSEPLDRITMEKMAANLGEITLYSLGAGAYGEQSIGDGPAKTQINTGKSDSGFSINAGSNNSVGDSGRESLRPAVTVGTLPEPAGRLDHEITFGAPLPVMDWKTGQVERVGALVRVQTRPAVLYSRLFSLNDFAKSVEYALVFLAIMLAVIVALALIVGTRLTRTVTRAVAQLYLATRHVNRGDFSHRIPVTSNDQLATLATSFNSMSESLQKLIEEQKEKQRLEHELVIAQEVQAQLFPREISQLTTLEVYGFCRPARTVSGDYYDFLTVDPDRMVMALGDVSGKGISAALLMATIHSAVRAYSLQGMPILRESLALAGAGSIPTQGLRPLTLALPGVEVSTAALLSLLNHQLYESTPTEKYATMFLSFYDGREHKLTYSNAGHLPPIILGNDGSTRRLECGGTVVGLFNQVQYEESCVYLSDGDIFLAYSDGVTEPENDYGEFGEQRLIDLVRENRQLPLARISEIVTTAVDDWIGANEQPDDVTLVLARVR